MKKFLKILLYIIIFVVVIFAGLILTAIFTDYKPEEKVIISEKINTVNLPDTLEFDIVDWNIGYCGLDASMDFFYDGGTHVRPDIQNVIDNLNAVKSFLKSQSDIEFYLIQEVDKESKRSYKINQYDSLKTSFPDYYTSFGKNYDVFFVPTPPSQPYGKVVSGLMTLSKFEAKNITRFQFPGNYDFPKGLFMLDRCFLVNRFNIENGKELLIINTHNSAYDDGSLKAGQMEYLKKFLQDEYQKGNYILVGGDWNQSPFAVDTTFADFKYDTEDFSRIANNYLPEDWKWIFSNATPTNRRVKTPYDKKTTLTTVIDFFLISPNIESISIENINLEFKNSDHQPVKASFKLKK
ncbi:MAG: hypothetical protein JXR51_02235 [Bacteroidales bacterium]|nr:hypothetical protein [Bacteroidales bacterium]MBN2755966.1 hypothetical protein [Bacteroidales bacterium]